MGHPSKVPLGTRSHGARRQAGCSTSSSRPHVLLWPPRAGGLGNKGTVGRPEGQSRWSCWEKQRRWLRLESSENQQELQGRAQWVLLPENWRVCKGRGQGRLLAGGHEAPWEGQPRTGRCGRQTQNTSRRAAVRPGSTAGTEMESTSGTVTGGGD